MKKLILHTAFLVLPLSPPTAVDASLTGADSLHFCAPFDYEQWRRDHPRPGGKRLADLNVGEPRTVRMIYFLPNDRPFRQEVVDSIKVTIREVQNFFVDQMEVHGYGKRTFRIETDAQGEPLVHRVDGREPDSSYLDDTLGNVLDEIEQVFDLKANIYLVVIDNSANRIVDKATEITGVGVATRIQKTGGFALITAGFSFFTAAHELGHTFGLEHDFQNRKFIMSYGDPNQPILSPCHAEFLTVHPYFNLSVFIEAGESPVIELLSSPEYPAGSKSVAVRLKLQDAEGLHQVFLLAEARGPGYEVLACRNLAGKRDGEVVFEYDGYSPSHADWGKVTSLSDKKVHPMRVEAVDLSGNVGETLFQLSAEASPDEPRASTIEIIAGDHQQGAPGRTLENALVVEVKDQNGDLLSDETIQFGVTEGGARLSGRYLVENATTDANGRAELTLTLGSNPETIVVRVSAPEVPECQPVFFRATAVGVHVASLPGDAETWHLPDHAIARLGRGHIGEGDRAVSFSPNGQHVAVASGIGVWLYDLAASRAIALFPTRSPVHSVAFSPEGNRLASSREGGIDLWDVATGTRSAELIGHNTLGFYVDVTAVAFSPDGTRLASGSIDQVVKLWDVATGGDIYTWEFEPSVSDFITVAFSPDDAMLAVGLQDGSVRLLDVATHEVSATLFGHRLGVRSVAFSRDGRTLATSSDDGVVRLWDMARRETVMDLTGHGGPVTSVSFSRDGNTLASASNDSDVKLWDVGTGTSVATLAGGHTSWATSVSFSPEGTTVASGSTEDGSILLWDVATRNAAAIPGLHVDVGSSVSFSPDGKILASSSEDGTPKIWDAETGRLIRSFGLRPWGIQAVAFSPDSTTLAAGSLDNTIDLWNVVTGARIASFKRGQGQILSLAFSPDGKRLAAGDPQGIALWDVATVSAASATLRDVVFGDMATDHYISTPLGYAWVWSLAFSVDGKTLASCSSDGTVTLWDASTLTHLATLGGDRSFGGDRISFSPDGTTLAATTWDGVELLEVATRERTAILPVGSVTSVKFSPDRTTLASGLGDGTVTLWDIATLGKIATLEGHAGAVRSLSFSRDGKILASGSGFNFGDGTVLLWDLQLLEPRPHTLIKVAGDEQEGPAGGDLAEPFVVSVLDQNGDPLAGTTVTFAVTAGEGTLSATADTTDENGLAAATLTLGSGPGGNTVDVTVAGLNRTTFTALGIAIPRTLSRISGDQQQGAPGTTLPGPFVVSVLDQNGTALAGVAVTFAVTAGDGTLSTTTATTDANGSASSILTLGNLPGASTVTVSVAGLEPVTFTATAEASPDFDGDGETGFSDFFLFADAFGSSDPRFDLDGSGTVDFGDFFLLADHFANPARGKLLALAREIIGLPEGSKLQQNVPNPFNSQTVISWFQIKPGQSRVEVFALTGQRVAVLYQGPTKAGVHQVHWNGRDDKGRTLASGVYLYRLSTNESLQTRKLTLLQ